METATQYASAQRTDAGEIRRYSRKFQDTPLLKSLFDSVSDMVMILDRNRQLVYANRALVQWMGLDSQDTLIGKRPGEIVSCENAAVSDGGCGTTEHCSKCGAVNSILMSQRGIQNVQECNITQLPDLDGLNFRVWSSPLDFEGYRYTIVSLTDISHEKRRRFLERIFFHDILNTAGGIVGFSKLLKTVKPERVEQFRDRIYDLSLKLVEEIESQKQIAVAETGELVVHPMEFRSLGILQEVLESYQHHDVAKDKNIVIDPESQDTGFISDAVLLRRILGNLVKNALEASQSGDSVTIKANRETDRMVFSVHNSGFIPRDIQLQMFKRSFSTKGVDRGLGTYSVRLLTERYLRGTVSFSSSEEQGTTFMIRLPLKIFND